MRRVVEKLKGVVVRRRVDTEGKIRLWGREIRVGAKAAGRRVRVDFDGEGDKIRIIVRDERGVVLKERSLEWVTEDWLWAGLEEQASDVRCQTYV